MAAYSRKCMQSFAKLSIIDEPPHARCLGGVKSYAKFIKLFAKVTLDVSLFLM